MVPHKATKFVMNKYPKKGHYNEFSITEIISTLNWDSLEVRRNKAPTTTVYKIPSWNLILPRANLLRKTRTTEQVKVGPNHHLLEPHSRLDIVNKTFLYSAPRIWNNTISPDQSSRT